MWISKKLYESELAVARNEVTNQIFQGHFSGNHTVFTLTTHGLFGDTNDEFEVLLKPVRAKRKYVKSGKYSKKGKK